MTEVSLDPRLIAAILLLDYTALYIPILELWGKQKLSFLVSVNLYVVFVDFYY